MKTIKWLLLYLLVFTFEINASHQKNLIREIPPSGIVISTPGTYIFANNITWSPAGNGQAILITANDVTLDLKNFTLRSETTSFNTTGIAAALSKNLTIKNGKISNMAYQGISCTGCSEIVIKNITVDGLNIEDTIVYTAPAGILVTASESALVDKCIIKNINVKTGSCAAIQMTGTTNSTISNCYISNLLNRDGACTGIGHLLCNLAEVKSCTIDNLQSQFIDNLNTAGHTAIGLIPVFSNTIWLCDCTVTNVAGCCDDAHGISVFKCTNSIVQNCKVSNISDGIYPSNTGAKTTGIEVYGSNIQVIGCHVKDIVAINPQNKQAAGFSCAEGSRITFLKCHAKNVKVINPQGRENPSLGYGIGFGWAPDPRIIEPAIDVLYKKCSAKDCQVGFDTWFHINSVWDHVDADSCLIGILIQNDSTQRTLSCDACSECGCQFAGCYPNPFSITITNVAANNIFKNVKIKD